MGFHVEYYDIDGVAVMETVFTSIEGKVLLDEVIVNFDAQGVTL